jgi:hypothetical protein
MPFEKRNVEYIPDEAEETPESAPVDEQPVEAVENDPVTDSKPEEAEPGTEGETVVIKSAKNKNYNAPRQDHCFIFKIKKLE